MRLGQVIIAVLFVLTVVICSVGLAQQPGDSVQTGEYVTIKSDFFDSERTVIIDLPGGYTESDERYPVLYAFNGQEKPFFLNVSSTLHILGGDLIPKMILVHIADADQSRHFLPVDRTTGKASATAESLLNYLTKELIPYVDSVYRTVPYRILYGQSNAGLFSVYTQLKSPESFDACLASSPMLGWCPDYMFETAREVLGSGNEFKNTLFMIYSTNDYDHAVKHIPSFSSLIDSLKPAGFIHKTVTLQNEGHVPFTSLYDGLRSVFADWKYDRIVNEPAQYDSILAHYAGLSNRFGFEIKAPSGMIFDLGFDLYNESRFAEAADILSHAARMDSSWFAIPYYLGMSFENIGDTTSAIEQYHKALNLSPNFARAKEKLEALQKAGNGGK